MKIVCDKNMPFAAEAFGGLGEVSLIPGRSISQEDVRDAEILATRSTTKVNAALLDGSSVRFYGSAVIGTDHIDIPYLNRSGIKWCSAPGCNAESVADYVTAALLWLGGCHHFELAGKTVGVVGVGNVGRRVCRHLKALGLRVLACDPPRQRDQQDTDAKDFCDFQTILREADIITCHVPLTDSGEDATYHMFGADAFKLMKPGVVFVNAARGPVTDTGELVAAIDSGKVAHAVIDCWEGEPSYRLDLASRAEIATPHIAGHSYEGKVNGTAMVYRAACEFLGVPADFPFTLPIPPIPLWRCDAEGRSDEEVIRDIVLAVYDIAADSERFREVMVEDLVGRAQSFDYLRSHYPMRRQFDSTQVDIANASQSLSDKLSGLGFKI